MPKSLYGRDNPKPGSVYKEERGKKKLIEQIRNQRDGLKFKAEVENKKDLVVGFSYQLSLRWRLGKPDQVTNCIVLFRKPLDRKFVERRIRDAF